MRSSPLAQVRSTSTCTEYSCNWRSRCTPSADEKMKEHPPCSLLLIPSVPWTLCMRASSTLISDSGVNPNALVRVNSSPWTTSASVPILPCLYTFHIKTGVDLDIDEAWVRRCRSSDVGEAKVALPTLCDWKHIRRYPRGDDRPGSRSGMMWPRPFRIPRSGALPRLRLHHMTSRG